MKLHARELVVCLLVAGAAACQSQLPPAPTLAPLATPSVAASSTPAEATEPAPALVFEEEVDPPTGTPLPKGTFYYFWEPA